MTTTPVRVASVLLALSGLLAACGGAPENLERCSGTCPTGDATSDGSTASHGGQDGSVVDDLDSGTGPGGVADLGPTDSGGNTAPSDASTGGGSTLCSTLGWCQLTNTKLQDVCPNPGPGGTCSAVVNAWSGAAADTTNNLLYIWGGGHTDYNGNEVYALDLAQLKMKRLNDPSPASAVTDCTPVYADGLPGSRHTYNGLSWNPVENALYAFGGSVAKCGGLQHDVWRFVPSTLTWTRRIADSLLTTAPGFMVDWETGSSSILIHDSNSAFYRYTPSTNVMTKLADSNVDYHLTGRIDPSRSMFVMMGGGQIRAISTAAGSTYALMNWDSATTGCDALKNANYPGLDWDPDQGVLVGWAGGTDVYTFNATTKTCTKHTYPGGPGAAQMNGTMGRFRYFPKLKAYVIVNDTAQDAYTLRMITP